MAQVVRAKGPTAQKQQKVNMVVQRLDHSEDHFWDVRHRIPSEYSLYRGSMRDRKKSWGHKNDIFLPYIFSTLQSNVARIVQAIAGANPVVQMVGTNFDDAIVARKRESLTNAQLKDANFLRKLYDLILSAELYGTGIIQHGYVREVEAQLISSAATQPNSQEVIQQIRRDNVTMYDGPDFQVIDILDWFPQPGFRDVEDMDWVIVREIVDLEDIRALTAAGMYTESGLRELERSGLGAGEAEEDLKEFRANVRTESESRARQTEPTARPVTLYHCWGTIPSEFVGEDGLRNRIITVANRTVLMRDESNPFFHGQKPFLTYSPMPDPHFHFGPGKVEISAKLQVTAEKLVNQALDAGDIFGDPAFFYNRQSGLDTRNLYMRPGRFIGIDGDPAGQIMPIQPDLRGTQMNLGLAEQTWGWMQLGTGIHEGSVIGGGQGASRETARGFLGRQEAASNRLQMEGRLAEVMIVEPLADFFNVMSKQFLRMPMQIFILGEDAQTDPITGKRIPNVTRETLQVTDMVPDYVSRAVGATARLNRSTMQQNAILLSQAVGSNPQGAAAVNWLNHWRWVYSLFEIQNLNELIATPQMQQAQLQSQGFGDQSAQVDGTPGQPQGPEGIPNLIGTLAG